MEICRINRVSFSYDKKKRILNDCSLSINEGEFVGLLGLNGCGKSTLFSCITGDVKYEGEILLNGKDIKTLKPHDMAKIMSYIPQNDEIDVSITALDVVLMGYNSTLSMFKSPSGKQVNRAIELLISLGLDAVIYNDYLTLSGGEKALVLLSRALVAEGSFMLLDEISASLDLKNKYEVLSILRNEAKSHNKTVLLSIHDPEAALYFCDRLLLMKDGAIYSELEPSNTDEDELALTLGGIYGNISVKKNEANGKEYYSILPMRE